MNGLLIKVSITQQSDEEPPTVVLSMQSVDVAAGRDGVTLRSMYELLDCSTVDVVRLADDLDMWVDDEGMYTSVVNDVATVIAARFGHGYQQFYGSALLLGGADRHGNTVGLSATRQREIQQLVTTMFTSSGMSS